MRVTKGIRIDGKFIPLSEIKEKLIKLKDYEDSELSPDEVHIISERLTEFEKAGLEPCEVIKLAERDKAVEAVKDEYGLMWCPSCKELIGVVPEKREEVFCKRCGQRVY